MLGSNTALEFSITLMEAGRVLIVADSHGLGIFWVRKASSFQLRVSLCRKSASVLEVLEVW